MARSWLALPVSALLLVSLGGCSGCDDDADTSTNGTGASGGAGGSSSGGAGVGGDLITVGGGGSGNTGGAFQDCTEQEMCPEGAICKYDKCIPDLGPCATHDDCPGDSYCDADGICIPYGVPPGVINDPECTKSPVVDIVPVLQCEWAGTAPGDPTEGYTNVYTAPMVAELNLDLDDTKIQPSVVVTTFDIVSGERIGMLRLIDGRTCEEQARIGGPDDPNADENRPSYAAQWAIGDLNGDLGQPNGHPEIVGLHRMPGAFGTHPEVSLIAYEIDSTVSPPVLQRKWLGRDCSPGAPEPGATAMTFLDNWVEFAPGLWDLDNDGAPETVLERAVFDADGCLLNGPTSMTNYLGKGVITTVADVDKDGQPELVTHDGVYAWNSAIDDWELEPWFVQSAAHLPGQVAVADFGAYSVIPGFQATDPLPEIVVVSAESLTFNPNSTGTVRIQTLTGDVVFGPIDLYHVTDPFGGHGGPPTASDFDGDGEVEFAAAANEFYTVYDPDCVPGGDPARPNGTCNQPTPAPDGILWGQPSQDKSSSITGSSIFDFDGNGTAEAVYADECYVRVYDGADGTVLFSAPASSGTGTELPVIVDVDGDFATEIVASRAANGGGCPSPDPLFPASGDFVQAGGIVIYRDPDDQWASSRPIWNQHAYSVTHVTDDGLIPPSALTLNNWEQPGMNNFRQNVQGALDVLALADLTVELANLDEICAGDGGVITIAAEVCNRGTAPVQDGALVQFIWSDTADPADGTLICEAATDVLLQPGECTLVECSGTVPAEANVFVSVDPDGLIADCHPGNNDGASTLELCAVAQ